MIRWIAPLLALVAFAAQAADVSGEWTATIVSAAGNRDYTYVFRQNGADLIGTVRSQDGLAAISDGSVNHKTITFVENVTVEGRRVVLEYTGELVSAAIILANIPVGSRQDLRTGRWRRKWIWLPHDIREGLRSREDLTDWIDCEVAVIEPLERQDSASSRFLDHARGTGAARELENSRIFDDIEIPG